jgi:hypothetical protein
MLVVSQAWEARLEGQDAKTSKRTAALASALCAEGEELCRLDVGFRV